MHGLRELGWVDGRSAYAPQAYQNRIAGQVRELPQLRSKLTRTVTPQGQTVHMQPPAVDVPGGAGELHFPPKYGSDTRRVLAEAGFAAPDVDALAAAGVIA